MLLDERLDDAGNPIRTALEVRPDGAVELIDDSGVRGVLPADAVIAVMKRYGRPLADGVVAAGSALPLGESTQLRMLRFRAAVDADSRDYAVLEGQGEPLAAIARTVAAALRFLLTRAS